MKHLYRARLTFLDVAFSLAQAFTPGIAVDPNFVLFLLASLGGARGPTPPPLKGQLEKRKNVGGIPTAGVNAWAGEKYLAAGWVLRWSSCWW